MDSDARPKIDLSQEEGILLPPEKHDDNTAGVGITGDKSHGIELGGYVDKTLGKFGSVEAEAGVSQKAGGFFRAFWRKRWGK